VPYDIIKGCAICESQWDSQFSVVGTGSGFRV
jgi:hypothetical protein